MVEFGVELVPEVEVEALGVVDPALVELDMLEAGVFKLVVPVEPEVEEVPEFVDDAVEADVFVVAVFAEEFGTVFIDPTPPVIASNWSPFTQNSVPSAFATQISFV